MLAFLAGDDWETSPAHEAGTSPVGIGGTLEQFPSALFPAYPECALSNADPLPGADWAKGYGDGNSGVETRWAHQPAEQSVRAACGLKLQDAITNAPNLPTDYPGLTLSTHVELPVSVVEAASARVQAQGGTLTESEMRHVLAEAGFSGDLLEQALRVSHGESVGWQPAILGDGGRAYGLFQIHPAVWIGGGVCEGPWPSLLEPLPNARCAKLILDYEAARRYPLWSNWTVKP